MRTTVEIDHEKLNRIADNADQFVWLLEDVLRGQGDNDEAFLRDHFGVTIKHQTTEATDES